MLHYLIRKHVHLCEIKSRFKDQEIALSKGGPVNLFGNKNTVKV